MNKELIKKYKAEFEHWLNGGNVQAFYKQDDEPKWWSDKESAEYDGNDNFSHIISETYSPDDVLVVIDDEYVEFRKALAEGKTVQYYVDSFTGWQDVKSIKQPCMHPDSFRIKPEEPKFKVGDWITDGIEVWQHKENCRVKNQTNWNLWQPKEGEYCWFWENGYKMSLLGKLTGITDSGKFFSGWGTYDYCEPFIGELPTNLKEQNENKS